MTPKTKQEQEMTRMFFTDPRSYHPYVPVFKKSGESLISLLNRLRWSESFRPHTGFLFKLNMVRRVFFALVPLLLVAQINIVRPPEPNTSGGASVFLNHFFLVLDSQTFKDIKQNDFLRKEFAPFESRRTIRTDRSYSGIYFYVA